jgi:hypothetical protein
MPGRLGAGLPVPDVEPGADDQARAAHGPDVGHLGEDHQAPERVEGEGEIGEWRDQRGRRQPQREDEAELADHAHGAEAAISAASVPAGVVQWNGTISDATTVPISVV